MENGKSISVWNGQWIPAPRPRSAKPKTHPQFLNPSLMVEHLINPVNHSWNVEFLNAYIHLDDVQIIQGLAISQTQKPDISGWFVTQTGKYMVKSGYNIEALYLDNDTQVIPYGPNLNLLLRFTSKIKCPPKLRHFIW